MKRYTAKFRNGETWVGGQSYYPDGTPAEIVLIGIRMSLESQGKIDDTWELTEFDNEPVELTTDGAILPKGQI